MAIVTSTKIGLVSAALNLIGEPSLESFDEDRYAATVGSNLFDLIYENELQSNRWRFACTKVTLGRLTNVPLNEWQFAYQLPTDMLLPLHVFPVTNYEIFADQIWTNQSTVDLDYMFKPEINKLPAYFSLMMVYALARDMIKPITESDNGVAIFKDKYRQQRDRAMFADAQGRPSQPVVANPFIDIRR